MHSFIRATSAFVALTVTFAINAADVDLNNNGLSDPWENFYEAAGLVADGDDDGDGETNGREAIAGTDPLDRNSKLEITSVDVAVAGSTIHFPTQEGKLYRVYSGSSLQTANWNPTGVMHTGDGTDAAVLISSATAPGARFFRVTAEDMDSDSDGLKDWSELKLSGYDPNDPNSVSDDQDDRDSYIISQNTGIGIFQVSAPTTEAFEKGADGNPSPAVFRISRTNGLAPVTVFYTLAGSTDPEKEPAAADDYNSGEHSGVVEFTDGKTHEDIIILPVADTVHEFPNSLTLELDFHPDYAISNALAEVTIFDATDTPENQVDFVALLSPERGAETSANGYGWIKLNGRKDRALVTLQFSGLTATQTAAHVHHSTLGGDNSTITNGPVVESLPLGQIVDHNWQIRRTGAYSPQQLIDALCRQNSESPLYINAHSMNYPGGEVWGFYDFADGATDFVAPADPPALPVLSGDDLTRDVGRFLTQSTFGASQSEIASLVEDINTNHGGDRIAGFEAWIDAQYALDQTRLYDLTFAADQQEWDIYGVDPVNVTGSDPQPRSNNRRSAFWHIATQAHDQLRQRVAFALSQILVVSELDALVGNRHYGLSKYYDMLGDHADGTYRDLLYDVSKSPIMGQYLSSLKNGKAVLDNQGNIVIAPDENYAREIMQLFSIGLLTRHPDGSLVLNESGFPIATYNNQDVTELARVFTGWSFGKRVGSRSGGYQEEDNPNFYQGSGPLYFQASWENPMKNFSSYHDTGAKTVLGSPIPAGQNGEGDLNDAIDILFDHPNTAPFISRLLIQRLVTSNPSSGYIYRVSQAFNSNRANPEQMKEVVKAILLDYEARDLALVENVGYGKQKEPLIRFLQLMRAFGSKSSLPMSDLSENGYPANQMDNFPPDATQIRWTNQGDSWWKQAHLRSPTVFNWFLPDHQVGGPLQQAGLVAPEFSQTNEYQTIRWVNYAYALTNWGSIGARELPLQRTAESEGGLGDTSGALDNITTSQFIDEQEAIVQANIDAGDTEEEAFTKLVDQMDRLLCNGRLFDLYGAASDPNPRSGIIAHGVWVYNPGNLASSVDRAVKDVLYLIATSPEFITQK